MKGMNYTGNSNNLNEPPENQLKHVCKSTLNMSDFPLTNVNITFELVFNSEYNPYF